MTDLLPPNPARASWLNQIIRFCLENKLVVGLIMAFTIFWGLRVAPFDWQLGSLPRDPVAVDAIPDIGENQQIVFTDWPGRSPQDVEDQITYPLTVALLGVPQVKTVRSLSMFGFSTIFVIFKEDAEFYWSRSRVLEKLSSLPGGSLPEGVRPALGPDATALGQIFWYTLEGRDAEGNPTGGWDLHELRTIQDWQVRYALASADGVSEVASVGGFVQEYQIDVDPDAMRASNVTLEEVFTAVKMSNVDVGARTIEVNRVEYVIRGLGFVKELTDLENAVIKVNDNVPIYVKNVGNVSLGPALRRGALDKEGTEVVGGVVVSRYGENPLAVIKNVKARIDEISPGLPTRVLPDGTVSKVTIVPFYDRTGLIYETLGTLNTALVQEILVTVIVVVVMVWHLRSSILIAGLLPLAVLMCFIAMRTFGVDANIVALSGIAIAIGTMVDMGIVICENILRHLDEAGENESRLEVIYRASSEVGSAVLTAVATTIVSFLPVFTMEAAEGKLFRPLAFTKTFALFASVIVALTIIPPVAHVLFRKQSKTLTTGKVLAYGLVIAGGIAVIALKGWWIAGLLLIGMGAYYLAEPVLPRVARRVTLAIASIAVVAIVTLVLTADWLPLGPEAGLGRNLILVVGLIGGLLLAFQLIQWAYPYVLRWCLAHKVTFLLFPSALLIGGLFIWLGPRVVFGPLREVNVRIAADAEASAELVQRGIFEERNGDVLWTRDALGMSADSLRDSLHDITLSNEDALLRDWAKTRYYMELGDAPWRSEGDERSVFDKSLATRVQWTIARSWNGLGKEFMPPLDEGSYLYMPVTMPHASIGEALDVVSKQDMAFNAIPEIDSAVGKIGRVDSPLDPAPVSMIETVIAYKPQYLVDAAGGRLLFKFDETESDYFRNEAGDEVPAPDGLPYFVQGKYARDDDGKLVPDDDGRPFRLWRPPLDPALNEGRTPWSGMESPDDIWDAIVKAGQVPGTTSAPKLQPIAARLVMLQSGMRAPMGVKIKGPDLESIEKAGLQVEKFLKQVRSVEPAAVVADRIVGKPYLEIDIDRQAIARYGIKLRTVQDVIEVAIGGKTIMNTVEGRERYPVRVRYMRELRDSIEDLPRILVPAPGGAQIPLEQLATINFVRGPQVIKSEDSFLIGYVLFDMKPGFAEVDVVEQARAYLQDRISTGEFDVPEGVSYTFAGSYENQVRSERKLMVVLPVALFIIFLILYMQFRSVITTGLVFSGIAVAWAGGFMLIWLYGQPWFLDAEMFGVNLRDLFQVHTINLSVAVWVGFLALFGIATDDGVVMATYIKQSFDRRTPDTIEEIRQATLVAGQRRVRPCLMTTATTILALLPVLTSTGRGSDIMVPMAIPTVGGMMVEVMTMLVVPVLYCMVMEWRLRTSKRRPSAG